MKRKPRKLPREFNLWSPNGMNLIGLVYHEMCEAKHYKRIIKECEKGLAYLEGRKR